MKNMARLLMASLALMYLGSGVFGDSPAHERLRIKNTFQRPEEVVAYYCARDASGFVWSGMLDAERRAFTLWDESPQQDTFYIASRYEILPPNPETGPGTSARPGEATVQVRYHLVALGDAHGTRMPVHPEERTVTYQLRKVRGMWKIARPAAREVVPIVLESKFQ